MIGANTAAIRSLANAIDELRAAATGAHYGDTSDYCHNALAEVGRALRAEIYGLGHDQLEEEDASGDAGDWWETAGDETATASGAAEPAPAAVEAPGAEAWAVFSSMNTVIYRTLSAGEAGSIAAWLENNPEPHWKVWENCGYTVRLVSVREIAGA